MTNLNSRCEFVLTEKGAAIWNARYDGLPIPAKHLPKPEAPGNRVDSQLWIVMEVFGPHTHMGMCGTFFEGNNLDITPC